ncbi:F0F1 ATP synthase subunit epsilon [Tessaracoccus caeni]|uniref:F0F1 ATP synthase subunit epsilon n=1 Tax=Tessaracoccus caeni TaxID=3031239 RepID=UPI0023DB516C|nr:F0F1 ATP synthase subunit epsilon [Tessaracoccus caeni]MDF1490114.1 F0F1 ATP synthase subunit epsilon [Tessaracoccus caeni]
MAREPLQVQVVAADRRVWSGEAVNVIARTTEGDIGILPGHEPLMAVLTPSVAEIVGADGRTRIMAVDGGFISVAQGGVSIISQEVRRAEEISLDSAERQIAELEVIRNQGALTDGQEHRLHILKAQVRAAERARDS